jgi:hypothetical protein
MCTHICTRARAHTHTHAHIHTHTQGCSDTFLFRYKRKLRLEMIELLFTAVWRVLRPGGTYINISPRKMVPLLAEQRWTVVREKLPIGPNSLALPHRPHLQKSRTHIYVHACKKGLHTVVEIEEPSRTEALTSPCSERHAQRTRHAAAYTNRENPVTLSAAPPEPRTFGALTSRSYEWWGPTLVVLVAVSFVLIRRAKLGELIVSASS